MSNFEGEEVVRYWLRWQTPICGLFIIGPALVAFYTIKNAKAEVMYLDNLWKPCWRFLNPLWLLIYRVSAFICPTPMLYEIIAIEGAFAFYFYTQWTFTLVMVYFALATILSAYGCWISSRSENESTAESLKRDVDEDIGITNSVTYRETENRRLMKLRSAEEAFRLRAGFWGYLMQTIYQASAGAVIITDIIFWCLIVPFGSIAHLELNVLMGCMHSLNAVFLLLDTGLNSLPFPWFRIAYFVQWSCLYVVFQWLIHAFYNIWWPYPFLDLEIPWAPLWYFLLALIHIPCYGIYYLIVKAKNSIFSRWFPHTFVRSS